MWTPGTDDARRPVLVWIHGGAFISGSGAMPNYSGETFARDGDLVVVNLNYRLGPLGLLSCTSDDGAEHHNVWLTDQLAALHWVQDNIAAFGGDPDNVTVAGQSAGALSTAALAGHGGDGRPFRRAILQSVPLAMPLATPAESLARTAAYLEIVGAKDVDELRTVPWPRLVEATAGLLTATMEWGHWTAPFMPVLDKGTAARQPVENLLDGPGADIDVLIGWTREESAFTFALGETYASSTEEQVLGRARDSLGDGAAEAYAAYAAARPGARPVDVLVDLTTDELFRKPTLAFAEARAARGRPVWAYEFCFPTPAHDGRLGAPHCLELPFVFDNFDRWSHSAVPDGNGHQDQGRPRQDHAPGMDLVHTHRRPQPPGHAALGPVRPAIPHHHELRHRHHDRFPSHAALRGPPMGCSVQMVFPEPVNRQPQRSVSWATRKRPRPPSSVSRARRRRGCVLLGSETSHTSTRSRISRSPTGPPA